MKKIMFNDDYGLTQATIDGRKTKTRRAEFSEVQELCLNDAVRMGYSPFIKDNCVVFYDENRELLFSKPTRYKIGEVVAIAQSYETIYDEICKNSQYDGLYGVLFNSAGWNNKMFTKANMMPHRIRITGMDVHRLQRISNEDCEKEGIYYNPDSPFDSYGVQCGSGMICLGELPREAFAALIDKVSGRGTWASNPWVVAYEYELIQ